MLRTCGVILAAVLALAGCGENDGDHLAREAYAEAQFARETDIDLAVRIDRMQREIDDLRGRVEYLESGAPAEAGA
ncbi:MAG: hypothetical protein O9257_12620 [Brevundimonas sp.]|jgi:hypothetical protein|nr:hypothetical protein [Brevundimonas sp.]